jgi:diaminopimelate decarboxylase/aspartate kinase
MSEPWIIMKFGGTSVAGRERWQNIATLVAGRRQLGYRVCVVCSAVAGVTNELTELASDHSPERVSVLIDRHRQLAVALEVDFDDLQADLESRLASLQAQQEPAIPEQLHAQYLSLGEWLSTSLGERFLSRHFDTAWVDSRDALVTIEEDGVSPSRRWLSGQCRPGADRDLQQRWGSKPGVIVTQGFIAREKNGDAALLGRGGSDTSAALLAGRLGAQRLEIWTDVPGLFSADPRQVADARLIHKLDYGEALEMAASGARVVHARAIAAVAAENIPLYILDTFRPGLPGTRIGEDTQHSPLDDDRSVDSATWEGAKAIIDQPDMLVLLLQNLDMRHQIGFLARVFAVFAKHSISVDLVATSETTTTVAFSRSKNHLETSQVARLVSELEPICTVEVFDPCTCINLVGRGVRVSLPRLQKALTWFDDHRLLMLSQSANDLCLSLLVSEKGARELLKLAHQCLIPAEGAEDIYGESWSDLKVVS